MMIEVSKRLKTEGWIINDNKFDIFLQKLQVPIKYESVKNIILDTDIKNYGDAWLDIQNKAEISCNGILQINKIRNVAAPEIDQDNKNFPVLNKYLLSDGSNTLFLLDLAGKLKANNIELGGKLFIKGTLSYKSGMMILSKDNCVIKPVGGKVLDIIKADSATKTLKDGRGDGAPKFLPFGNKLNINVQEIKNFKAMKNNELDQNQDNENSEFGTQRVAEIEKVKKDLAEGQDKSLLLNKFHSGGRSKFITTTIEKQDQEDNNLACLLRQGFQFQESKKALAACNNDVRYAVDYLLQQKTKHQMKMTDEFQSKGSRYQKGKKKNTDCDEDDPWFDPAKYAEKVGLASRPNTTMNLNDMLQSKHQIPEFTNYNKSESVEVRMDTIQPGDKCQAQVMNGSYEPAVILDILPRKCLKIRYINNGEEMETSVSNLKGLNGEKLHEYMVPNIQPRSNYHGKFEQNQQYPDRSGSAGNYRGGRYRGNRGRPFSSRGSRGRY